MGPNDLISYVAQTYELDRPAAVQAIVATAGVIISVSASIAALISAWATARSVKEMRAARLQHARPSLLPVPDSSAVFTWYRESNRYKFDQTEGLKSAPQGPILKNLGFGAAHDVNVSLGHQPIHAPEKTDIETLQILFGAAGLQIVGANNGIEIRDPERSEATARLLSSFRHSQSYIPFIDVNGTAVAPINHFFIEAFIISALSYFTKDGFSWAWPVSIDYKSFTGQTFKKKFILGIFSGPITYKLADPIGHRKGVPNWSEISLELNFRLNEVVAEQPIASMILHWVGRRLSIVATPFLTKAGAIRQWCRNMILFGGKPPRRFQIGDRVSFIPHEQWKVTSEPSEPFEVPPLEVMEEDRFKLAE